MKRNRTPTPDLETIMPILIGIWRRYQKEPGPPDVLQTREFRRVVEAIQTLQAGNFNGQDYFSQPELLGAYLLYQWVIHYQQGLSLIGELPWTPRRVLDVASGPAPFAFASLRHGAQEVYATDRNQTALNLGAEVCGRYGMPINIRKWDCLNSPLPVEGKFDLIIVAHALQELFPDTQKGWVDKQEQFIKFLLKQLSSRGFLLLVDNSFLEANRRLLSLRDRLVQDHIPIQAPCIWRGECPALKSPNSPCYAQREMEKPYLIKEFQRAAQINLNSLKMSYIIFRHPDLGWPSEHGKRLYRVISPPFDSYQGTRYYLCGADGKKSLGSHLSPPPKEARAFEFLRRGELIAIEHPLEKSNALDIIEGTKLSVEAACGKPLEEEPEE